MNMPTYTTSTAIHTAQFSRTFRVIIHCATRLVVAVAESTYGSAASVKRAKSVPSTATPTTAIAVSVSVIVDVARETVSSVRFAPPYSHSYHPYSESTK